MSTLPLVNTVVSVYTSVVTSSKAARMTQNHRTLRRCVLGIVALLGGLVPGGAAYAGGYPPTIPSFDIPISGYFNPQITTTPNPAVAGANFTVTVSPCVRDTLIPITFQGETQDALCTNPYAKATFRAPSKPGTYTVSVRAYIRTVRYSVRVVAGNGANSDFPNTGATGLPLSLSIGTSALVTGIGLYVIARRRHRMRLAG